MALERRENWRLMFWLVPQRFGYRQIMYYVVIKALIQAWRSPCRLVDDYALWRCHARGEKGQIEAMVVGLEACKTGLLTLRQSG